MKVKYALALSGGAFNGAFQIGALQYLSDNWKKITGLDTPMKFDIVAGTSTGAINGALIAQGEFTKLRNLWLQEIASGGASEVYTSEFIDTESKQNQLKFKLDLNELAKRFSIRLDLDMDFFRKVGLIFSEKKRREIIAELVEKTSESIKANIRNFRSIADNTPLLEKLKRYLDSSKIKDTVFTCGFVSLNSGRYHSVTHTEFASPDDYVKGVLSSSAMPVIWNPVDKVCYYRNEELVVSHNNVDGGIVNVSPLGDVIRIIADDPEECEYRIIVVNCNCGMPQYEAFSNKSIGAIAARSIYDLSLTEIFNNDVQHFLQINDLVKQVSWLKDGLKSPDRRRIKAFDSMVISPSESFNLGSALVANEQLITKRFIHGFEQARLSNFK